MSDSTVVFKGNKNMLEKTALRTLIAAVLQLADSMLRSWGLEKPVLYSADAVELLMGTFAKESWLGRVRRQILDGGRKGRGRGIGQMEPETEASIWEDMFPDRPGLERLCREFAGVPGPDPDTALIQNIVYQILMTRFRYLWVPGPIPKDLDAMAIYWRDGYNAGGKGTAESWLEHYQKYAV